MPNPKKEKEVKSFVDRWGLPIEALSYICDNEGNVYMVNSHFQAVPQVEDAPAVALEDLMKKTTVRVLKPEEVLKYVKNHGATETDEAREAAARNAMVPGSVPVSDPSTAASLALALQAIPDVSLASELRRRGYYVTAVKPALIEL